MIIYRAYLSCDPEKGETDVMLEVARFIWMIQAKFHIDISYEHIPVVHNSLADALSRAHLSPRAAHTANQLLIKNNLRLIHPCLNIFKVLEHDVFL